MRATLWMRRFGGRAWRGSGSHTLIPLLAERSSPMGVSEIHVASPVIGGQVMMARPDMVPEASVSERRVGLGHSSRADAFGSEKLVYWTGQDTRKEFALGIGPCVTRGACHVGGAGSQE